MSPDRADFQKALENRKRQAFHRREKEIRQLAQAEVPMTAITSTKEWDYFLSLLQAQIDMLDNSLQAMEQGHVLDPSFSYEDMARQKALMMQVRAQKETLEEVLGLPKQIIEQGEKAKLVLRTYSDQ